mgnify:CR=1 FL=1|jgi:hypothetical protein
MIDSERSAFGLGWEHALRGWPVRDWLGTKLATLWYWEGWIAFQQNRKRIWLCRV